ncbi:MAG: hypothetical protein ABIS35_07510 [Terracoccus sp.]
MKNIVRLVAASLASAGLLLSIATADAHALNTKPQWCLAGPSGVNGTCSHY